MLLRLLALFALVISYASLEAQNIDTVWCRTFSSPTGAGFGAIAVDHDGNVCVAGEISSVGKPDYLTIKYRPNGDTAWLRAHNWPNNAYDYAEAIACDASGNIYIAGTADGGYDPLHYGFGTIRYLPNGDTSWTRLYVTTYDSWCNGLAVDSDGNAVVTGYTGAQGMDYLTVKYLPNGDTAWARTYDGPQSGMDRANAVTIDDAGDIYVVGSSTGVSSSLDIVTIKYLPDGQVAWVQRYNGTGNANDYGNAVTTDRLGNVYVSGLATLQGGRGGTVTLKYSALGSLEWKRIYSDVYGSGDVIVVDDEENVYVGSSNARVLKYLPDGTIDWVAVCGGGYGGVSEIALDSSGGCVVVGGFTDSDHPESGYIFTAMKLDQYGHRRWVSQRFSNQPPNSQVGYARTVALDAAGDIYVAGGTNDSAQATVLRYKENWCGDVDHSYALDVSDAVYLVQFIFGGGPGPDPLEKGDVNGDGAVDINDVVYLLTYIFSGGSLPCAAS